MQVENDANFATLAEAREGSARDLTSFLYFLMNSEKRGDHYVIYSLGSTLFLGGRLYRGTHYGAGEIDALLDSQPQGKVTAKQLNQLAKPDGPLTEDLRQMAKHIAATLTAMVDLIDPQAVIHGGNVAINNRRMVEAIQTEVNNQIVPLPNRSIMIRPSLLLDQGVSMGAAIAAVDAAVLGEGDVILSPRIINGASATGDNHSRSTALA